MFSRNTNCFRKVIFRSFLQKCNSATTTTTDFEEEYQKHHIPINLFQRSLLTIGSAAVSIMDPHRGDMIACLGETTGKLNSIILMVRWPLKVRQNMAKRGNEGLLQ